MTGAPVPPSSPGTAGAPPAPASGSKPASHASQTDLSAALQLLAELSGASGGGSGPGPGLSGPHSRTGSDAAGGSGSPGGPAPSQSGSPDGAQSRSLAGPLLPAPSLSASAALAPLAHSAQPPAAAQVAAHLQAPLGTSAWIDELGTQLTWMAQRGIESASLQVAPAELGPIEARIAVHGSNASVWFGAAHPATRTALESALPQLRHLFAAQGLALADTGVFREAPRRSAHQAPAPALSGISAVRGESARTDVRTRAQLGLLDLYA